MSMTVSSDAKFCISDVTDVYINRMHQACR